MRHIALRCAGFNNVDLDAAARLGLNVVRDPAYSPNAVAEHTIALILSLNRHIHKASNRVIEPGVGYVSLDELLERSRIVSLNCPLTVETHHLVSADVIARNAAGMLVNTGRGALIGQQGVVAAIKSGQIGSLALDVYEEEAELFFEDRSAEIVPEPRCVSDQRGHGASSPDSVL